MPGEAQPSSPIILSLETATRAGGVALSRGPSVLASRAGEPQSSHSSDLLQLTRRILDEAGVGLSDVELFAAAAGPGSFTGLRIGLATVKAFASSFARPCAGVPTLHAVALSAGRSDLTLALLPAGRGELFAQLLRVGGDGLVSPADEPAHLPPEKLFERVKTIARLTVAAEGAGAQLEYFEELAEREGITLTRDGAGANLESGPAVPCAWRVTKTSSLLAESVAALAHAQFLWGEALPPEDLRAVYVRLSDAELNVKWR
ncbi:MAG TPA: tRNA (adenosine(37)-N6)-threonylcarbamoyltransferase complex dimerization subunit type 1 TsaB [Pyrinomonadaceae bacterium]